MVNMDMVLNCEMKKPEPRIQYEKSCNERVNEFYEDLTDAAEKSKSHAVGNALSLSMIPYSETMSYGMAAFHSDKSTVNDPIIKISCNYGGEQRYYDVHVNEVNPHNASAIEMFAVCAYLDEQGVTDKGTFGSYNKRIKPVRTEFDWLSVNEVNVDRYIKDPYCGFPFTVNGFKVLFDLIAYIQDPENYKRIPKDVPLFLVSGKQDPVGSYGEAVKEVAKTYREAGVHKIHVKLYAGDRHELLNEKDHDKVDGDILSFIELNMNGRQKA